MGRILGVFQAWPPGQSIETDRRCNNRDFCTFLDGDALSADGGESPTSQFMCVGCNEEMSEGSFESVTVEQLNKSRIAKGGPAY